VRYSHTNIPAQVQVMAWALMAQALEMVVDARCSALVPLS
jgi:hypothetical protein